MLLKSIFYMSHRVSVIALLLVFSALSSAADLPPLPEGVSNNAVAKVSTESGDYLLSFMGLGAGKTYREVHNKVWALNLNTAIPANIWQQKSPVPSSLTLKGRLASIAVGVKDKAYIFGGYTVAEDHSEVSSPDNFTYQLTSDTYTRIADTPVPVDDAVALVYQQRFIYLISGWHNDGNVNLVQLYDIQEDSWQQASPFLGVPVFGHAGGIVDNKMLLCDGVKVQAREGKRRTFVSEPACYLGIIDPTNPHKIDWRVVKHPRSSARYRMAAAGIVSTSIIVFFGGSDNPYNYNGIGYDGVPSEPSKQLWIYDLNTQKWLVSMGHQASMDHRGAVLVNTNEKDQLITIGGMGEKQKSLSAVKVVYP
ncbi:MAG: N-acetylneuraminic acid mutarotase [Paraglaciecola sp.]|jgi:N-acetylneuraminic acid mutarotase